MSRRKGNLIARTHGFHAGQIDTARVASGFPDGSAEALVNMRPESTGSGAAQARGGLGSALNALSLSFDYDPGWAMLAWFETALGVQQLVLVGSRIAYSTDYGATWTTVFGGGDPFFDPSLGASFDVATMRVGGTNYLLMVNGTVAKKWDGTTLSDLANCPSGARTIAVANSRCWVAVTNSNFVYGSAIDDPEVWNTPDGVFRPIGGTAPITALAVSPLGPLVIAKRRGVALLDGFGDQEIVVAAGERGISDTVGIIHHRSIAAAGDAGLCWQSERGIEFFDGEQVTQIGRGLDAYMAALTLGEANSGLAWGFWEPRHNEYHLLTDGAELAAVVSLSNGAAWRAQYAAGALAHAIVGTDSSGRPETYVLGALGFLYAAESGSTDAGSTVSGSLSSALYDFGRPATRKRGRFVRVVGLAPAGGMDVELSVLADGLQQGDSRTISWSAAEAERPVQKEKGVSARGHNVQVQLTGIPPGGRVAVIEVEAEPMQGNR